MIVGLLTASQGPLHFNQRLYQSLDPNNATLALPVLLFILLDFYGVLIIRALYHTGSQPCYEALSRIEGLVFRESHPLLFLIVHALLDLAIARWTIFPLLRQQHLLENDTARGVQVVKGALVAAFIVPRLFHYHICELCLRRLFSMARTPLLVKFDP